MGEKLALTVTKQHTTMPRSGESAVAVVLRIPELLELIFCQLRLQDLVYAAGVCQHWKHLVAPSPRLQQILVIKASPQDPRTALEDDDDVHIYCRDVHVVQTSVGCIRTSIHPALVSRPSNYSFRQRSGRWLVRIDWFIGLISKPGLQSTFITQPPCRLLHIVVGPSGWGMSNSYSIVDSGGLRISRLKDWYLVKCTLPNTLPNTHQIHEIRRWPRKTLNCERLTFRIGGFARRQSSDIVVNRCDAVVSSIGSFADSTSKGITVREHGHPIRRRN